MSASERDDLDRVSVNDLTTLATDRGQVPMNIGAVLFLAPGEDVADRLGWRLARIRRFRQRLLAPPPGAGRPLWVDDPAFDLGAHVHRLALPSPVTEDAVLDAAAGLVCTRLPGQRPLWALGWADGLPGDRAAVVLVLHHVLADGMGGLAVLASLADGAGAARDAAPAARLPSRWELTADALRTRVRGVPRAGAVAREAWQGLRELGVFQRRPKPIARTTLNQPTSSRRTLRVVRCPLSEVLAAGHRQQATVNDVVLAAVSGALFDLLAARGEHPAELVVSVPVSMRQSTSSDDLGNQVGAAPVTVAFEADPQARLQAIAQRTKQARGEQRGHSALVLSWLFRGLARLHVGQFFLDRQRLVHTFETNLRGPSTPVSIGGRVVERIVPIAVNPGNVGVSFDVLSYAGELVISIVADPRTVPDVDLLAGSLRGQLASLTASGGR